MIPNPRPPPRAARGRAGKITPLDLAAKIDETASFLVQKEWGEIDFPAPFGRPEFPEEKFIRDMDAKTGASLKLTILNHTGRVWTMVVHLAVVVAVELGRRSGVVLVLLIY